MHVPVRSPDLPTSVALWVAAGMALPADVYRRLQTGGMVLEVGCGNGLGCLALAEAYPTAYITGHDRRPEHIARAYAMARSAGLDVRVTFAATDSRKLPRATYDLAALRTLSDRHDALEVLNAVRNALVPEGVCVVAEARARFSRPTSGRLQTLSEKAGFSLFKLLSSGQGDVYELRR